MKDFGKKIKELRCKRNLTREDFCQDQSRLSVRQLARIENGQSIPNLTSVFYIAEKLDISISTLIGSKEVELPKRYKELKYKILRTPTYTDENKLSQQYKQFSEIFDNYYDKLPEVERFFIDCLQASIDVTLSKNTNYGYSLINGCLEQLKKKQNYFANDLILMNLYLVCCRASKYSKDWYDEKFYYTLFNRALEQIDHLETEDLFLMNQLMITFCSMAIQLGNWSQVSKTIKASKKIMLKIDDFQRLPILHLMEWKYNLYYKKNYDKAKSCYKKAIHFALLMGDKHLKENIKMEWKKDKK
ncbi:helix-turn-helix domain-containing protein [Streptococcus didelphis]|uniref:helix-turn-helix domain-containing protein n=1 Tax=Streptococcus didelphis TaxID=102886 RepID=UPI0003776F5D|nr:XRE family transcriptional regulator [Streptococcus didelphis]